MESIASKNVQNALKPIEKEIRGEWNTQQDSRVTTREWMWFLSHFHVV